MNIILVHVYSCIHIMSHLEGMNYFDLCEEYDKNADILIMHLKNMFYENNEREINKKFYYMSIMMDPIWILVFVLSIYGCIANNIPIYGIVIIGFALMLYMVYQSVVKQSINYYMLQTKKVTKEMIEKAQKIR